MQRLLTRVPRRRAGLPGAAFLVSALTAALAILIPSSAFAAALPITGPYCGEGGFRVTPAGVRWDTATAIVQCVPEKDSTPPPVFHLSCITHSDLPRTVTATIKEDPAAGTLSYADDRGSIVLHRCAN